MQEIDVKRIRIDKTTERRLYAESMGRCMNPACKKDLLSTNGDIMEKAHICAYTETADNSFENLVILCPNCHTDFDKNNAFTPEEVLEWKRIRQQEIAMICGQKFDSFDKLSELVVPILLENKKIYEGYYLNKQKKLWDMFEAKILVNNKKLKTILKNNLDLIQRHDEESRSNLNCVYMLLQHIEEFERTRIEDEKVRSALFPVEIYSIFGIEPITSDYIIPMTESLELLIKELIKEEKYIDCCIGIDNPYLIIKRDAKTEKLYLSDEPRLRQLYYNYKCFRPVGVRLESLNYALKCLKQRNIDFSFINPSNLREIEATGKKIIFVYEYCLSKASLIELAPEPDCVIVNLHNWNGKSCISSEAYDFAETINVKLLTTDDFIKFINNLKNDTSIN